MPTVITQGAASAKGYGFGASSAAVNYIEDVFSTYLYTGNGSTQTITNGINLSGKGGLVWTKGRSQVANNKLVDTARGATKVLISNATDEQATDSLGLTSFSTTGYSLSTDSEYNSNGQTYASWTFRKQAKFFDIVTFTTPASGTIVVPHNLGSTPGCVITKATGISQFWVVNHRSLSSTEYLVLNDTAAKASAGALTYTADANNVTFSAGYLSASTAYVMYLFAHDAGGFGATGADNVISCGSFSGAANTSVNLGYEPQFVLWKNTTTAGVNWGVADNMRGLNTTGTVGLLVPNTASSETSSATTMSINSTGFTWLASAPGATYIYIAIRRGPMKTPTTGTSVFSPIYTNANNDTYLTTNHVVDFQTYHLTQYNDQWYVMDRLRGFSQTVSGPAAGVQKWLDTASTAAETSPAGNSPSWGWDNTGIKQGGIGGGLNGIFYNFRRAPGFFDVVCYTGNAGTNTISHNLTVAPELMIVKARSSAIAWVVYCSSFSPAKDSYVLLNTNDAVGSASGYWGSSVPSAASINLTASYGGNNSSGVTYVAYLFATVAGVSKVGSYTGTAALQTINCGFTGGARFVLIKRTDSTGDWYVWDSARGISSSNDPYLLLNSTAAEVTGTNYVDTTSVGFQVTAAAPAGINANGGTYIFLAIA